MTTIQDGPTKDQDKKVRTDLSESRLRLLTATLGVVTALITAAATIFGINWKQSEKDADTAVGKADASSARIQQLQRENSDLQSQLAGTQQELDELKASPSASAAAPAGDVVYLDGLSPTYSTFEPTSATVRGVSYEHAFATPVGCVAFDNGERSSAEYAISAKKLVRFRATILLSDDVGDLTVLDYYLRVNGTPVAQGHVEPGKVVTIDRTVKEEARTVTFGFTSDGCPLKRGEGIWADARLSRS